MKTIEAVAFKNSHHEQQFKELLTEQRASRASLYKREMAVIYTLSAMNSNRYKSFLHERGCFPQLNLALQDFRIGNLEERDVVLFALALNLHNGQDVLSDFGIEASATPFDFIRLLKEDVFVLTEAVKVYREGYPLY